MSRIPLHPEQDPYPVPALYLSRLDHESLYSNTELRQAIAETVPELDEPGVLGRRYAEALRRAAAGGGGMSEARRRWALLMAEDLARDRTGVAHRATGRPAADRRATSPGGAS
ncbi:MULTISPECIES: hypothetical protein [unclassified Streptomyces]|uniref:hypothetical protein n=1 Tax=unclassified Streptomyces TaxID=2593676 RepID=UPI002DDB1E0E|nr:hypothetical protein [Streptomyces sp. NBC_01750]WSB04433.1 hypothetical protein OIE54_37445 [Streptomyces sp. NBC_01794]WSD31285.1 hypothetical protein OG966_04665 [Streptomyces sp. NBC_01750]